MGGGGGWAAGAGGHGSFSSLYLYPTMKCLQRHLSDGRLPTGIQYSLRTGIENNRVNVQIVMTYERSKTFAQLMEFNWPL